MRALVIGATGLVGATLVKDWRERLKWDVVGTCHKDALAGLERLEATDAAAVEALIKKVKPEAVVMAASNPHVDYCETHAAETRAINVDAPVSIARLADKAGAAYVFFSSDYVFDGKAGPYAEGDKTAPLNEYGRQKVAAEQGIATAAPNHAILRISGAFGWEKARKNFVLQLIDRANAGELIRVATDVEYNPTYSPNLAAALAVILEAGCRGIYHAVGRDAMPRYEFAVMAAKIFGIAPRLEGIGLDEIHPPAKRPKYSSLKSERLPPKARDCFWSARQALTHMKSNPISF